MDGRMFHYEDRRPPASGLGVEEGFGGKGADRGYQQSRWADGGEQETGKGPRDLVGKKEGNSLWNRIIGALPSSSTEMQDGGGGGPPV